MDYFYAVVTMLAGLGVFLVGFKLLSDGTAKLANQGLKKLFNKASKSRILGVLIGVAATAIIQSSSVTTVMVVGFVNAGAMDLFQATTLIMGANIGTTITAQIVALQAFNVTKILMLLVAIGITMNLFLKRDKLKTLGLTLAGLGLVFAGLEMMSSSMSIFKESPAIVNALQSVNNPFLLLFLGIAITGIIQSSAAVASILISMVSVGLVIGNGGNAVLYVILGTNIGTCVTALISSIGATANGKRASFIHLMFNVFGATIFMIMLLLWPSFTDDTLAKWFTLPGTQIAMFHTFFNVACVIIFLPFTNVFVKISKLVIKDRKIAKPITFFDPRLMKNPPVAVAQLTKETSRVGALSMDSLRQALEAFIKQDENMIDDIREKNHVIEKLNSEITEYLIEVSTHDLSLDDEKMVSRLHHALGDFIRIAEISDNVLKYTRTSIDNQLCFSDAVKVDLHAMYDLLAQEFRLTSDLFVDKKFGLLGDIEKVEDQVDHMRTQMLDDHVKRLNEGACSPNNSAVYINFVSNLERVGDHINYVAHSYLENSPEATMFHD